MPGECEHDWDDHGRTTWRAEVPCLKCGVLWTDTLDALIHEVRRACPKCGEVEGWSFHQSHCKACGYDGLRLSDSQRAIDRMWAKPSK